MIHLHGNKKYWYIALTVFTSLLVYGSFTALVLSFGSPDLFIVAGDKFTDQSAFITPEVGDGYDGQFYYRLALDPFTNKTKDFGITLDSPRYRHQRILYPFLAWLLALGKRDLVPVSLIIVNLIAIGLLSAGSFAFIEAQRRNYFWGVALWLYPGFLMSFRRDLAEILAATFLVFGLLTVRKSPWLSAGLLALAALTRETTLLVPFAICVVMFFENHKTWYAFGLPLVLIGVWQVILFVNWGNTNENPIAGHIMFPFWGLAHIPLTGPVGEQNKYFLVFIGLFFLVVLSINHSSNAPKYVKMAWLGYTGLLICLSTVVWVEAWAYMRALTEWYLLGWIIIISAKSFSIKKMISFPIRSISHTPSDEPKACHLQTLECLT